MNVRAAAAADDVVRKILLSQWRRAGAVRVDSPPGAGKTGVVERIAAQSVGLIGERCAIATQTNAQAFDLATRLGRSYPSMDFWLFARRGLELPEDVRALTNIRIARAERELPKDSCVVISNAHKWSYLFHPQMFDLLVVDEAFQLPDFRFHQIANLGERIVLIGDPGQISPILTCEIERWRSDLAGPHVAAPDALLHRYPEIERQRLPVSRRLIDDTVQFVQPAFYPDLPFSALSDNSTRCLDALPGGRHWADAAIDRAVIGQSMVALQLPERVTGQTDLQAAQSIVQLVERLIERRSSVGEGGVERSLTPADIGVVCAHVAQVNAIVRLLPEGFGEVFVETADRFQGLERQVMIIHHPLSGHAEANQFHMDIGRLCVMLSRHRVGCFVVFRAGIDAILKSYQPNGDRILGLDEDREHKGWCAQTSILNALIARERVISVPI